MRYLVLLSLCLAMSSCSKKADQKGFVMPASPVHTAEVVVRDVPLYFEAMGTIKASQSAEIKPQVTGMITCVHFLEGQWVQKGDLLYTIDEAPFAVRVEEAEAVLAQNEAQLKNAKSKLNRYRSLSKQDFIAKVEWDEMEKQVALYEAAVQGDQARLKGAKLDLAHCRIVAPISGRTGRSALDMGNMASNSTLVTISQVDPLLVDFDITEEELTMLPNIAPDIEVYAAGCEDCTGFGHLTFIDPCIDAKSGMVGASGILETQQKNLWPGQSVRVHVVFGKKQNAKLIPIRAVKTNQSGPYIFSVKADNTVEILPVKLGPEEKGLIVVEEGLKDATKVVIEGHLRLFPGSKVEESVQ